MVDEKVKITGAFKLTWDLKKTFVFLIKKVFWWYWGLN
jgi:hypothetical protein